MNGISREEAIFSDVLAQPPAGRGAFLAKICGDDVALLGRMAALVAAHEGADSLLAGAAIPNSPVHEEKPGDRIGYYRLLQKIGEGGCGVVWMAEQEEPVRRRIALKVIKLGMDTKAVVARFEAERQALALMDHPNIAKVHDAGATETGRPFFVMELVRGITITKYCDENHLTPTERLELFIKVCQAVQHAHQKGIIHRDLKPSNILVTVNDGAPTPKVIDFGIAKATRGRLTDATVFTAFEQFIGTPVYMSPEQAEMSSLDIDTRTDVYSLGVLLYELLTGRPPFDSRMFAHGGVDEIRRHLREDEPPKPSAKWRTLEAPPLACAVMGEDQRRGKRSGSEGAKAVSAQRSCDAELFAEAAGRAKYRTGCAHRVMRRGHATFAPLIAVSHSISDISIYQPKSFRPIPKFIRRHARLNMPPARLSATSPGPCPQPP